MKKIVFFGAAAMALATACNEMDEITAPVSEKLDGISFTVPAFERESGSRMVITPLAEGTQFAWALGDTIGVFPANGYQTAFPISDGAGSSTAVFDGADWALRPNASYAAYYPFQRSIEFGKDSITASYVGQVQVGNDNTEHLSAFDYLYAPTTQVDESGNASFAMNHLGSLVRFSLTIPEPTTLTGMLIKTSGTFAMKNQFELSDGTSSLKPLETSNSFYIGLDITTTVENENVIIYAMMPPTDYSHDQWKLEITTAETDYKATFEGKNMEAGKAYAYNTVILPTIVDYNGHEYVDLGLSMRWATMNIGATSPEQTGDRFAWGDVDTYYTSLFSWGYVQEWKPGYESGESWENYKWATWDEERGDWVMTKYYYEYDIHGNRIGGKDVLDPEDDAAHVLWGGTWRMPTIEDVEELANNTIGEQIYLNGRYCYKLVSRVKGYTDKLIIINDNYGCWTSSLYQWSSGCISAYTMNFESYQDVFSNKYYYKIYSGNTSSRHDIQPIRPVCPAEMLVETIKLKKANYYLELSGEGEDIVAEVLPAKATIKVLSWESSDPTVATVDAQGHVTPVAEGVTTITATATDGSHVSSSCNVYVYSGERPRGSVDMGLSVLWADMNIGAEDAAEMGTFFAWGEVEGYNEQTGGSKTDFSWDSYKWGNSSNTLTKYNTSTTYGNRDNKRVLEADDDAAQASWGGDWRMPTKAEMDELIDNCEWTWVNDGTQRGYLVTSMMEGYEGVSIFFPAGGYYQYSWRYNSSYCYYWTSSVVNARPYQASYLYCSGTPQTSSFDRPNGMLIRAVKDFE